MQKDNENQPGGEILLYQTEDGKTRLEVQFQGDTVWLSQAQMSELFQTTKQNVSLHIQNIYEERELERTGTVKESLTVRQEGNRRVSRSVEHYNLDMIIAIGYRARYTIDAFRSRSTFREFRIVVTRGIVCWNGLGKACLRTCLRLLARNAQASAETHRQAQCRQERDAGGMNIHKNVGWVRPEAVTHQTEKAGYAALTRPECLGLLATVAKTATVAIYGFTGAVEYLTWKTAKMTREWVYD